MNFVLKEIQGMNVEFIRKLFIRQFGAILYDLQVFEH